MDMFSSSLRAAGSVGTVRVSWAWGLLETCSSARPRGLITLSVIHHSSVRDWCWAHVVRVDVSSLPIHWWHFQATFNWKQGFNPLVSLKGGCPAIRSHAGNICASDPSLKVAANRPWAIKGLKRPIVKHEAETKRIKYSPRRSIIQATTQRVVHLWPPAKLSIRASCKTLLTGCSAPP